MSTKAKRTRSISIANLLAFLMTAGLNYLTQAIRLNGNTIGEVSDRFDVYFVPAGYAFSIWGLIYLGLGAFCVFQLLPSQRKNPRLIAMGVLFVISCLANIAWLFLWHYEQFPLTWVAMVILLVTLVGIYLRLEIGRTSVGLRERVLVRVPFSLYLGWISVATIANTTILLDYADWSGWGISPEIWTVIMLVVGVLLAATMVFMRGDLVYAAVIAWAYVAIAVKHGGTPVVHITAWSMAGAMVMLSVFALFLRRHPKTAR